jgi:DNA invertase Pin-like site-specific DNA recombinase
MANALIVHKDRPPQSQRMDRAAQYVRMSTDYQRYSIENQAAVIAAYAQAHGLTIVCTYRDEGESGLKIKNRKGLTRLMEDVQSGHADFDHILVFDVSRWGRFQDVDESAYHEYACKRAGIKVAYYAEQFDNDGSLISNIVKNIKRVMAAEYSRDLSAKVHAGASRLARLGFKMGGPVGYGLERIAVDEKWHQKGILKSGEQKYLSTDRVRVQPGTVDERAVVKWIFEEFVRGRSQTQILRELNERGVSRKNGLPWSLCAIFTLLRNEAYIGNLVWNRASQKLRTKKTRNPSDLWIRSEGCVEPIIDRDVFFQAQKILSERRICVSEHEMLTRLRKVLMKKGSLSAKIINATPGLPTVTAYAKHFGSLRNVYRLIGYNNTKFWDTLEIHRKWLDLCHGHASQLCEAFEGVGERVAFDSSIGCLRVDDAAICFGLAKWCKYEGQCVRWRLYCRARWPARGWTVGLDWAPIPNQSKTTFSYPPRPVPAVNYGLPRPIMKLTT